jgi:Flp pilus assembly protein TadG
MLDIRALKAFAPSRRGNVAIIAALLMPILVFSSAIAVDTAKIFSSKRQLQQSLDSAALAAGKQYGKTQDKVELARWAKGFFLANAQSKANQNTQFTYEGVMLQNGNTILKVSGSRDEPTFFGYALKVLTGGSFNHETWPLYLTSQIIIENRSVEMALVLDNSGSMKNSPTSGGTVKITTLKQATTQLVTQVLTPTDDANVANPVKLAIVPFSGAVNVGPQYADAIWMDTIGLSAMHHENFDWSTWKADGVSALGATVKVAQAIKVVGTNGWRKIGTLEPLTRFYLYKNMKLNGALRFPGGWEGCVESRPSGLAVTDTTPDKSNPDSLFVPLFAPSEYAWSMSASVDAIVRDDYIPDTDKPSTTLAQLVKQNDMNKYFSTTKSNTGSDPVKAGPNFVCDTTPITPLTTSMAGAKAAITAMQPVGATNIPEGLAWGWRVLSSGEPFTQGVAARTENNLKVLVLMTDGENTYNPTYSTGASLEVTNANASMYGTYGFGQVLNATKTAVIPGRMFDATKTTTKKATADNYVSAINEMTTSVCENIKADGKTAGGADGIVIFAIAFDLADTSPIKQRLKACASNGMTGTGAKLYYDAKNSADLLAAFASITSEISSLRVAH